MQGGVFHPEEGKVGFDFILLIERVQSLFGEVDFGVGFFVGFVRLFFFAEVFANELSVVPFVCNY